MSLQRLPLYLLAMALAGGSGASAQPAAWRVADLETSERAAGSSSPLLQARLGGRIFFAATDPLHGEELWSTDGSAQGTVLVADLCPGRCSSAPRHLLAVGDRLLLSIEDRLLGRELWLSDGSREGTRPLGDLCPGSCSSVPLEDELSAAALGEEILFVAREPLAGRELWATDGTVAGTRQVTDLWPGAEGSDPSQLTTFAGRVHFSATSPEQGRELWSSDGTEAGTRLAHDLSKGPTSSRPLLLATFEDRLLFAASPRLGYDLWTVDSANRLRLFGNVPCHADCASVTVAWLGPILLLSKEGIPNRPGGSLWRLDPGTGEAVQLASFAAHGRPTELTVAGDRAFFRAHGDQLWVTDGTVSGTALLRDFRPHGPSLRLGPQALAAVGERVVFAGFSTEAGLEPWVSDGTAAGTRPLGDLVAGPPGSLAFRYESVPGGFAALDDRALFTATVAASGQELWVTDGTVAGTALLADLHRDPGSSSPNALTAWRGRLFFSAFQNGHGFDPWSTDGTASGTARLRDLPEQPSPSTEMAPFGAHLYFPANEPPVAGQLWRSDGTEEGTRPLVGTAGAVGLLTPATSRLYFSANPSGPPCTGDCAEPHQLPLGGEAAFLIGDLNPSISDAPLLPPTAIGSYPHDVTVLGERVIFVADDGRTGDEPWVSDGTVAGTEPLGDLCPGRCSAGSRDLVRLGGWVLFATGNRSAAHRLWRTDGTPSGTEPLYTFDLPGAAAGPRELVVIGERVFLLVGTPGGDELWRTDGTAGGTERVSDLALDGSPAWAHQLTAAGGRLYLGVHHASTGEELWTSDGTAAGTHLVADLAPGPAGSGLSAPSPAGERLLFAAADGVTGLEPWVSDGTAAGTFLLQDLAAGGASSSPAGFTALGDRYLFSAADPDHGRELWALDAAVLGRPRCRPGPTTLCLLGGRFALTVDWTTGTAEGHGGAQPRSDESGLFWFFAPGNSELAVKMVDGGAVNGHVWLYAAPLSDLDYTLVVEEVATGRRRTYHHPSGDLCGHADTLAFALGAGALTEVVTAPGLTADATAAPAPRGSLASGGPAAAALLARPAPAGTCVAGPHRLCFGDGRFAADLTFHDPRAGGAERSALAQPFSAETGFFSFFAAGNLEVGVKLLDGTAVNGRHWVFFGALTDLDYTLVVTDTTSGSRRSYRGSAARLCGGGDTAAF